MAKITLHEMEIITEAHHDSRRRRSHHFPLLVARKHCCRRHTAAVSSPSASICHLCFHQPGSHTQHEPTSWAWGGNTGKMSNKLTGEISIYLTHQVVCVMCGMGKLPRAELMKYRPQFFSCQKTREEEEKIVCNLFLSFFFWFLLDDNLLVFVGV